MMDCDCDLRDHLYLTEDEEKDLEEPYLDLEDQKDHEAQMIRDGCAHCYLFKQAEGPEHEQHDQIYRAWAALRQAMLHFLWDLVDLGVFVTWFLQYTPHVADNDKSSFVIICSAVILCGTALFLHGVVNMICSFISARLKKGRGLLYSFLSIGIPKFCIYLFANFLLWRLPTILAMVRAYVKEDFMDNALSTLEAHIYYDAGNISHFEVHPLHSRRKYKDPSEYSSHALQYLSIFLDPGIEFSLWFGLSGVDYTASIVNETTGLKQWKAVEACGPNVNDNVWKQCHVRVTNSENMTLEYCRPPNIYRTNPQLNCPDDMPGFIDPNRPWIETPFLLVAPGSQYNTCCIMLPLVWACLQACMSWCFLQLSLRKANAWRLETLAIKWWGR